MNDGTALSQQLEILTYLVVAMGVICLLILLSFFLILKQQKTIMANLDQEQQDLQDISDKLDNISNDISTQSGLITQLEQQIADLSGSQAQQGAIAATIAAIKEKAANIAAVVPEPTQTGDTTTTEPGDATAQA